MVVLGTAYTVQFLVRNQTVSPASLTNSSTGPFSVPTLIGWGGIRMDEAALDSVNQPDNPPSSNVFPGEPATSMEMAVMQMQRMGYNTVRVDFDPYCTDTVDFTYMSVYSEVNAQRAVEIAQHYGFWIILDYHGYTDIFANTDCWLSYWKPIVENLGPLYQNIVWEPENEPSYQNCVNSPSSCPTPPCSDDNACVTYLGSAYQQWIDQARSLGDNHWIVVQNLCSYSCGYDDFSLGYPTVTDPLGTLSQGGKIFISLHSYMDYNATSSIWSNSTAEQIANQFYQAVLHGVANTGWPALNTEGGTDPLSCDPNVCAPDTILDGSAGYTAVTFHFIQTLVNLYDINSPQRINWVFWPAGAWTNTPGAGTYGALQCDSNPIGWGCILQTTPIITTPSFTISSNTYIVMSMQTISQTTRITVTSLDGFSGTVDLTATANRTGLPVALSSQTSNLASGSSTSVTLTVSPTSQTTPGNYIVTIVAVSGTVAQSLTLLVQVNHFGDLDGDGKVTITDLAIIAIHYGAKPSSANWYSLADLNHDGLVDLQDLALDVSLFEATS